MHYLIYKITNNLNGKIYIGKHKTEDVDDKYMGSGKLLQEAYKKYGQKNFSKEIIYELSSEAEMNAKEAELVTKDFVKKTDNYNLCPGGHGGFGYLNSYYWTKEKRESHCKKITPFGKEFYQKNKEEILEKLEEARKRKTQLWKEGKIDFRTFLGKTHTEETKQKMRKPKNQGTKNSQYGTMWITNGSVNKKVPKDIKIIPDGFYKGRTMKK